jgi:hypothetical protein
VTASIKLSADAATSMPVAIGIAVNDWNSPVKSTR